MAIDQLRRITKIELTEEERAAILGAALKKHEAEPLREPEALKAPSVELAREMPQQAPIQAAQHIEPLTERVATPRTKSERLVEIEKPMSSGLDGLYATLPPVVQARIKAEGEKTASAIEQLIESGKAAAKKVLKLLRGWLEKIPGVNAFFLEQESKIKTDRIMAIARKTREG